MANMITLTRLILLYVIVVLAYHSNPFWQLANTPLVVLVFILDAVDGSVARRRKEVSLFGALFDIAVDRIVENVLWLILADLDLIPVWVAIVFITRSFLVDLIRTRGAAQKTAPFLMMKSPIGRFIVAGGFMRIFYGVMKAASFGYILLIQPLPALLPGFYEEWSTKIDFVKMSLVYTTVLTCVVRALPVLIEFLRADNDDVPTS
jgi:CDP-diacylglycerol--glycerol-3-phosphate 3-phosphatidyltransferase